MEGVTWHSGPPYLTRPSSRNFLPHSFFLMDFCPVTKLDVDCWGVILGYVGGGELLALTGVTKKKLPALNASLSLQHAERREMALSGVSFLQRFPTLGDYLCVLRVGGFRLLLLLLWCLGEAWLERRDLFPQRLPRHALGWDPEWLETKVCVNRCAPRAGVACGGLHVLRSPMRQGREGKSSPVMGLILSTPPCVPTTGWAVPPGFSPRMDNSKPCYTEDVVVEHPPIPISRYEQPMGWKGEIEIFVNLLKTYCPTPFDCTSHIAGRPNRDWVMWQLRDGGDFHTVGEGRERKTALDTLLTLCCRPTFPDDMGSDLGERARQIQRESYPGMGGFFARDIIFGMTAPPERGLVGPRRDRRCWNVPVDLEEVQEGGGRNMVGRMRTRTFHFAREGPSKPIGWRKMVEMAFPFTRSEREQERAARLQAQWGERDALFVEATVEPGAVPPPGRW